MSGVREWDDEPTSQQQPAAAPGEETAAASAEPQLFFGSVDEFVREKLRYVYVRRVGPSGPHRWAAEWWRSPEAISRLEALWRAWEALRLEPSFGMSVWWRDHADHHMAVLLSPDGPFADSRDRTEQGEPLPYSAPPAGMFVDTRTNSASYFYF
ncbi:DUF4913 domain-containing protein [Leucobacter sp. wl10]|uniref:DUF4913 domain-containing protein n=1 Tax=Leucobacter sp. wl10 TaxID=2304677 RepID=UPI000E5BA4FA|nr:DUF4913 domain-containing protein [Leucobacter sp. wl10]RGE19091.1 DUF4913 domain-containing protein [Leucobacter sp. wl10]